MTGSWLADRNPSVKLGVVLLASLAVLPVLDPAPVALIYALALLGTAVAGRVPTRTLVLGQTPFLAFAAGVIAVNAMTRPGTAVLRLGAVVATREGLLIGCAVALRTLLIGVLTIALLASTPPRSLMVSLVHDLRLSPRYAYAILAGHRMLVSMPRRWATIRAAQRVRAPLAPDGRPRRDDGLRAFGAAAFTLLVSAVRSSERTALALESRGLGRPGRTLWRVPGLSWRDATMAVVVLGAVGGVVGVALAMRL